MKTFGKFQLFAVAFALMLGTSGCLDSKVDFGVAYRSAYIVQTNSKQVSPITGADTVYSRFKPYFLVETNEQANVTIKSNGVTYPLKNISGNQLFVSDFSSIYPEYPVSDTIPNGTYQLVAKNGGGETATTTVYFKADMAKRPGMVENVKWTYDGATKKLSAQWQDTKNTTDYYLVTEQTGSSYQSLVSLGKQLSMEISLSQLASGDYRFFIGAANDEGIISISDPYPLYIAQ